MDFDKFFEIEMKILEDQFDRGEITYEEFKIEESLLKRDLEEQEAIQDIQDAGRGYLLNGKW
jgi:hypothetical protein